MYKFTTMPHYEVRHFVHAPTWHGPINHPTDEIAILTFTYGLTNLFLTDEITNLSFTYGITNLSFTYGITNLALTDEITNLSFTYGVTNLS